MKLWLSLLSILLLFVMLPCTGMPAEQTEIQSGPQNFSGGTSGTSDPHRGHATGGWEGSAEGKAYSEFNHHLAGFFDTLFGLAELGHALQYPLPLWTRLVLPGALGIMGAYLFIWSDHDAWPVGALSFMESFFGQDREIVEHKFYGVLAVLMALCEALRRMGRVQHPAWAAPLVFSTLIGGLLLFVHSHGNHPANERIEFHHALLGTVGVGAALSKAMASWVPGASRQFVKWAEVAWAGSVILFGLLLLVYSE